MSVRYYAGLVHDSHDGQRDTVMIQGAAHPSYTAATAVHADRISRQSSHFVVGADGNPRATHWRPTVLLDLSTVGDLFGSDLWAILYDDPVLAAVFQLGRKTEFANGVARRNAVLENPDGEATT